MPVTTVIRGLVAGAVLLLFSGAPAFADVMSDCEGADVDLKYKACSTLIEAGKLPDGPMALAYNHRGMALIMLDSPEQAVEDFSEAIKLNPDLTDAYSNRGHAFIFLADFDAALKDFNKTIKLKPNADAYAARATVFILTGVLARAHGDLTQALKLEPDNLRALSNRAMVNRLMGNVLAAIADYNQLLKRDPEDEDAKRNLRELLNDPDAGASASLIKFLDAAWGELRPQDGSNRLSFIWAR